MTINTEKPVMHCPGMNTNHLKCRDYFMFCIGLQACWGSVASYYKRFKYNLGVNYNIENAFHKYIMQTSNKTTIQNPDSKILSLTIKVMSLQKSWLHNTMWVFYYSGYPVFSWCIISLALSEYVYFGAPYWMCTLHSPKSFVSHCF